MGAVVGVLWVRWMSPELETSTSTFSKVYEKFMVSLCKIMAVKKSEVLALFCTKCSDFVVRRSFSPIARNSIWIMLLAPSCSRHVKVFDLYSSEVDEVPYGKVMYTTVRGAGQVERSRFDLRIQSVLSISTFLSAYKRESSCKETDHHVSRDMFDVLPEMPLSISISEVCFPIFAQAIDCWLENIMQRNDCNHIKLFFLTYTFESS